MITLKTNEKTGRVVAVLEVSDDDELIVTSKDGMVIRIPVESVRQTGRSAVGVKIMQLNEGDKVMAVERLIKENED